MLTSTLSTIDCDILARTQATPLRYLHAMPEPVGDVTEVDPEPERRETRKLG